MKKTSIAALGLAVSTSLALAQTTTDGEVRKIDTAQNKITLRHAEIKNLDMPPMSMVFEVSDPKLLGPLKSGDKVRFAADKINGKFTVTAIEVVR